LAPTSKLHDLHPVNPPPPADTHWTTPVSPASLSLSPDGRSATLTVSDLAVVDTPKFPFAGPTNQATVTYKATWTAMGDLQELVNTDLRYRVHFYRAQSRIEWSTQIPELGFSFTSDAIETSQSPFALLVTREVNGVYFDEAGAPGLGAAPAQVPLP